MAKRKRTVVGIRGRMRHGREKSNEEREVGDNREEVRGRMRHGRETSKEERGERQ